jgi:outer membrane protein assembly factor BamE (lipoprotein component of BamABCDE complex)
MSTQRASVGIGPSNKGIELSKPESPGGSWPTRLGVVESGFAAHAQCYADTNRAIVLTRMTMEPPIRPRRWLVRLFWAVVIAEWAVAVLLLFFVLGLFAGVGAYLATPGVAWETTRYAPHFSKDAFQKVVPGMPEDEVLHLLGTPLRVQERAIVNGQARYYTSLWTPGPSAVANAESVTWRYSLPGPSADSFWVYNVEFGRAKEVVHAYHYFNDD